MSGYGQSSSSQSVKRVRQGISIRLDGLSPISARKTSHYLYGNRLLYCFLCCFLLRAACQHQSTSTGQQQQQRCRVRHRHSAASRQKHQTTMDAFLGGKRSPSVSSELLRSFFDVIPKPNKARAPSKCWKLVDCTWKKFVNMWGLDWKCVRSTK